jgi:hypothetical protein
LHGRCGFYLAAVEGFAADGVGFAAFAGAQGELPRSCLSIRWWVHVAECGGIGRSGPRFILASRLPMLADPYEWRRRELDRRGSRR